MLYSLIFQTFIDPDAMNKKENNGEKKKKEREVEVEYMCA